MRLGFLLPLIFGFLVYRWLRSQSRIELGRREALLFTAAAAGVCVVIMTEALSACHALTTFWVTLTWTGGGLAMLALLATDRTPIWKSVRQFSWQPAKDPLANVLLLLTALIIGFQVVLAYLSVPNAWDSMYYHLARVAHWLQNQSVGIYATTAMAQNQQASFSEWAMLQLLLLQGNDHLATFVQLGSYVGSIAAVSLIAEVCGGSRGAAITAAFFAATLPIGLLQATCTDNDEVLSFWILCLAFGMLKVRETAAWPPLLFSASVVGLAMLSKATAYLLAPAFLIWLTHILLRRGFRSAIPRLAVFAALVLLLNAGFVTRNWTSSGTLLGSSRDADPGYDYENEIHTPAALASNFLRNLSLQTVQLPAVVSLTERAVKKAHHILGIDPSDPRTTNFAPYYFIPCEALPGDCSNPIQLLLVITGLGILACNRSRFSTPARILPWCVFAGVFFFCLVVKWQPFHSRMHLVFFMLLLPIAAVGMEVMHFRWLPLLSVGLILAETASLLFYSDIHPLVGPRSILTNSPMVQRFTLRTGVRIDYDEVLATLRGIKPQRIGVIDTRNNNGWEYPLFDPDRMAFGFPWQVEQVRVTNFYSKWESRQPLDALILLVPPEGEITEVNGQTFHRVFLGQFLSLYLP